ncbi:DEKNAAC103797 [Brettanomyces naardenensis]|uniref:DEKNAAC103797 n=1 Tax=Brettanomyces naardenensis TaxID=13370 RepID=A0A448YPE3_BRENA|nr:DEKNAAC103797 [Brettanomyces naardenensis]
MPSRPSTPLHPDADQEIEAPGVEIPKELTSALDLGSEEDTDEEIGGGNGLLLGKERIQGHDGRNNDDDEDDDDYSMDSEDSEQFEKEERPLIDADASIGEPLSPRASPTEDIPSTFCAVDTTFFDNETEKRRTPVNPFGVNERLVSSEPIRIIRKKSRGADYGPRRLSMTQQSRLIDYIDGRLMAIQRRYIKYLSAREDPDNEPGSSALRFGLSDLAHSLDEVVTIIWYSIFKVKTVPFVYHYNVLSKEERNVLGQDGSSEIELDEITPDFLFGQTNYLIKIMGDLADYLEKFQFTSLDEIHTLLLLFAKLDNIISILIDEYSDDEDGIFEEAIVENDDARPLPSKFKQPFISNTEKIRIDSIINRTKLLVIGMFDGFKEGAFDDAVVINGKKRDHRSTDDGIKSEIQRHELLIGEIYEGILDRTSI